MSAARRALHDLCSLLSPYVDTDAKFSIITSAETPWSDIIDFANQHLLIPSLFASLHDANMLEQIPDKLLVEYMETLYGYNQTRNEAILHQLRQLAELLSTLNISPVLMKGAAALSEEYYDYLGERVMSDIDIWVPEDSKEACITLLQEKGNYRPIDPSERLWQSHQYRRIYSDEGTAALELHYHLLAKEGRNYFPNTLVMPNTRSSRRIPKALVLNPTYDLYHIFLHSEIQDFKHEEKVLPLRGLYHATSLIKNASDPIDWKRLAMECRRHGLSEVWQDYLQMLHQLFRTPVPDNMLGDGRHLEEILDAIEFARGRESKWLLFGELVRHTFSYRHLEYKYELQSRREYPGAIVRTVYGLLVKYATSPEAREHLKNYIRHYVTSKKYGSR